MVRSLVAGKEKAGMLSPSRALSVIFSPFCNQYAGFEKIVQ
jgi:hypothetical protein